jgi:hypothetical protein
VRRGRDPTESNRDILRAIAFRCQREWILRTATSVHHSVWCSPSLERQESISRIRGAREPRGNGHAVDADRRPFMPTTRPSVSHERAPLVAFRVQIGSSRHVAERGGRSARSPGPAASVSPVLELGEAGGLAHPPGRIKGAERPGTWPFRLVDEECRRNRFVTANEASAI